MRNCERAWNTWVKPMQSSISTIAHLLWPKSPVDIEGQRQQLDRADKDIAESRRVLAKFGFDLAKELDQAFQERSNHDT